MPRPLAALAIALCAAALAWAGDLYRAAGLLLYPQQFLCGMLALALPLTFLTHGIRGKRAPGARAPSRAPSSRRWRS